MHLIDRRYRIIIAVTSVVAALLMVIACSSKTPRAGVGVSSSVVRDSAASIGRSAGTIDELRLKIEEEAPAEKPHTDAIGAETDTLRLVQKQLEAVTVDLKKEEAASARLAGELVDAKKEIEKLEKDRNSLLSKMLAWAAVACLTGIVVCVLVPFFRDISAIAAFAVGFCVCIAAQWLIAWAMWIALGMGVLLIAAVVWVFIVGNKRAGTLVNRFEAVKPILDKNAGEGWKALIGATDKSVDKAVAWFRKRAA